MDGDGAAGRGAARLDLLDVQTYERKYGGPGSLCLSKPQPGGLSQASLSIPASENQTCCMDFGGVAQPSFKTDGLPPSLPPSPSLQQPHVPSPKIPCV
eukprot:62760-Chlamydomonas_euryale.AAC.1